ncbi:type IV toxin-antitoxin system AbiEi family antitoxin domain-containing protein [Terrabacter sp. BE26]|uniref:type IV toxin-antitoxin system AbiEi family antitoxin domain-containing protein n=1 Tax=Terrabacter sp. BE26 TaxID=2898152 RepID=UPI0035BE259C
MADGATGKRTLDRLLAARVAGQAGLVTRTQLLSAGWSGDEVRWRVSSGRWLQVHRGVYLTTPGRRDWESRMVGALLAVGPPCCLTGASAGQAWGLVPRAPDEELHLSDVEVLVPTGRSGADLPGVRVRRSRHFTSRVHPTAWPPRTTIEHTAFDLALGHGADRALALVAKACQLRLTTESELAGALLSRPTHPHRRMLAEALGLIGEGAESAAEVRYARDIEGAHGLPKGTRQLPAPGARSRDSAYAEVAVVVEIDGRLGHVGWTGQQRAGARDRKAAATGLLTVRGGWTDVAVTPCDFAADLALIFRNRGWTGRARPCGAGCSVQQRAA